MTWFFLILMLIGCLLVTLSVLGFIVVFLIELVMES
uniref:NADH dehydrogenase subunit 1 n=1 Tax=Rhizobium phage LG08 TaxID=3129229 RepID=A0AAU8HXX6_9CAUD